MIFIVELLEEESSQELEKKETLSTNQSMMIIPYAGVQNHVPQVLMIAGPHSGPQYNEFQEGIVKEGKVK